MNSTMLLNLMSPELFNIFIHSFVASFIFCIPFFTVFLHEKYVQKKNISHFETWFHCIFLLFFITSFNMYRLHSDNCDPQCIYLFIFKEFPQCCKEHKL